MIATGATRARSPARYTHVGLLDVVDFAAATLDGVHRKVAGAAPKIELLEPGLKLAVHLENARYENLLREHLCARARLEPPFERMTVVVASAGQFGLELPMGWRETFYRPREVEKALARSPFRVNHVRDHRYWQLFDTEKNFGVQWMPADDGFPPWEPAAPLRSFLHWFYSARGMRLAHAGTLGRNGSGIMLVGSAGAGKSATVIGGLLNGLETVGDDYVLVECTEARVVAHSIFRTLKQDSSGLDRLGLGALKGRPTNWQDKYEFFAADIGAKAMPDSLDIKAVVIPQLGEGARLTIAPVSPARAMLALAPTGLFQMPGERDGGVALFAKLVRSLPCYTLTLGADAAEYSGRIAALLDELPA